MESTTDSNRFIDGGMWFIRLRWIAIAGICLATKFSDVILKVSIQEIPLYVLAGSLLVFNIISLIGLRRIRQVTLPVRFLTAKTILYFQIITDLIVLTCLLHYSGGVENPFIIYYIFHMIISSILLSPRECFLITSFALCLIGALAFLEYQGIIPHYTLEGFYDHSFYQNKSYLIGTGFIFITTSYMVVYMTSSVSSRLRKQEEAYRLANIELQNKDVIKNEYVLRLTHDIKGHIAAIQNILRAAMVSKSDEDRNDFLTQAHKRSRRLMNFVKDLLRLTSLRLQHKLDMTEFSIKDSLMHVIQEVKTNCPGNIEINSNIDTMEEKFHGDQLSIEEVLNNLISNAIKYSPEGGTIYINTVKEKGVYSIEILDNGIGIPRKEQKLIFSEFYRASNVKKIEKGSSGFGLSLVKQIVEMHTGKLILESEEGKGTRVTIKLPFNQPGKKKTTIKWI